MQITQERLGYPRIHGSDIIMVAPRACRMGKDVHLRCSSCRAFRPARTLESAAAPSLLMELWLHDDEVGLQS